MSHWQSNIEINWSPNILQMSETYIMLWYVPKLLIWDGQVPKGTKQQISDLKALV